MNRHVVKSITLVMVLVALLCSFIFAGCATPTSTPEPTEKPASATPEPVSHEPDGTDPVSTPF